MSRPHTSTHLLPTVNPLVDATARIMLLFKLTPPRLPSTGRPGKRLTVSSAGRHRTSHMILAFVASPSYPRW
ncbi:unnamed protein product [Mesocestoides corti]|uniref:Uncharacterized protein n=1 Tax=Mesocestoides corti TaxID=53468 RepID=A0A0R3URJ6_MESCO|nr:unnamed protein product [Mesocestoides corti]